MGRKRLLVVEDKPHLGDWLSEKFPGQFDVLQAQSGLEAINKAVLGRPSCIVLDAMMPQIGDLKLSKVFKIIETTRSIPILVVCEKSDHDHSESLREIGAVDEIAKPFSVDEVSEAISKALGEPLIDRRKTPRLKTRISVVIRGTDIDGQEVSVGAEFEDVSRLGALAWLPIRMPVGQQVEIHRLDPGTQQEDQGLSTKARVVWDEEQATHGYYWHGLEFLTPSPEWIISQYLH